MIKLKLSLVIFLTLICLNARAQDNSNIEYIVDSTAFGKDRTIKVFIPARYHQDSTSTYIVTYVLDAQSDEFWNMAKSNIAYMVNQYSVIPMLVVGIVSDNRSKEFSMPATQLQQHLKNEVFPLIESKYRVKDFRVIVGHSRGGAFVANTLFSDNNGLFDGYIGISPSLGHHNNATLEKAASMLKANSVFKKYLYLSYGDVGGSEKKVGEGVQAIDALIKKYPNKSLAWKSRLIKGTDHWQLVIPSLSDGLISMSRNYLADQQVIGDFASQPDGELKQQIKQFYLDKDTHFGFAEKQTPDYLRYIAEDFRDTGNYKNAVVLFKMALEEVPDDIKVNLSLADTYEKMQEKDLANEYFKKTLALLEQQQDSVDENYYFNVSNWLKGKLNQSK